MTVVHEHLRHKTIGGLRFVARDRRTRYGWKPEHAIWRNGRVVWVSHPEGAEMRPFFGPDDVFHGLTENSASFRALASP